MNKTTDSSFFSSRFTMDLDDTQLPFQLERFADNLERRNVFARRYSYCALNGLYIASGNVWRHLCALDTGYYDKARECTLTQFANCFAEMDKEGFNRILK
jgi:hypothetical protein